MTCDVTADRKKSLLWGDAVFAGVFGVAALILALMDALGSGSLLIGAMAAIIIALAFVGALKGQLKQTAQQSAAGGTLASQWKEYCLHGFRRLFCCAFRLFCRRERAGRELLPHKSNAARREKMACPFVIETARGCTGRCG